MDERFTARFHDSRAWLPAPAVCLLVCLAGGCGVTPRGFRALTNPAAIVRARSVGYGDRLPDETVIPALIERLKDTDPVVRLAAFEELKQKSGQDFGYIPWGRVDDNAHAIEHWQAWWEERKVDLARSGRKP